MADARSGWPGAFFESPYIPLSLLGGIFGWAVVARGAVVPETWDWILGALATLALLFLVLTPRPNLAPVMSPWLRTIVIALPVYVAFQLLPLPLSWLRLVSPAKSRLAEAFGPIAAGTPASAWEPIAVRPAITLHYELRVIGYLIVFLLVRQFVHRFSGRVWTAAAPIVIVAAIEGALALVQVGRLGSPEGLATGTYINRNHYAAMLEMAFPFALVRLIVLLRGERPESLSRLFPAAKIGALAIAIAVVLFGILASLSRSGAVAAGLSLLVVACSEVGRKLGRRSRESGKPWLAAAGMASLLVAGLASLSPNRLTARFTELATPETAALDRRMIWSQTLRVIADYPLTGCGLGGYQAAYLKYKTEMPLWTTDFVHNDYLQVLAEFGVLGSAIAAAWILLVVRAAASAWRLTDDHETEALALACCCALAAIFLHSFVDFNLYIPANAMELAWISGIAVALSEGRTDKGGSG